MPSQEVQPLLNAEMYPHLIDSIFLFAPSLALLRLRATGRTFLNRADALLARHLVAHNGKISPQGLRGSHPLLRAITITSKCSTHSAEHKQAMRLLRANTKIFDLEHCPPLSLVRILKKAFVADHPLELLRCRRKPSDLSRAAHRYVEGCEVLCIVHRMSMMPLPVGSYTYGPAISNDKTPGMNSKEVFHLTINEFFIGEGPDFCQSQIAPSEVVVVLHSRPGVSDLVYSLGNDMKFASDLLGAMKEGSIQRLKIINIDLVPHSAYELPNDVNTIALAQYSSYQHPFASHFYHRLSETIVPESLTERVRFLSPEEYEQEVGPKQFALEMEMYT